MRNLTLLYDLHVHTTASDGVDTPEEVILTALKTGLRGLAITDHDTVTGLRPAYQFIKDQKIEIDLIPGIELNTDYGDDEVHILGYFIDFQNKNLIQRLSEIRNQRYERAEKIIAKLQLMGFIITFDEVQKLAQGNLIGRPHIARALCNKGYACSIEDAFRKFIDRGMPAYVPRYKFHPREAINLIRQVGGISILAHPGLIKDFNKIYEVIDMGVEGLEIYYPEHSSDKIMELDNLAEQNHLLITGGSDYHGPGNSENRSKMGAAGADISIINRMREYYGEKKQK
jgi:predicted metal-dependent phosphoesterase TrpH